MKLLRVFGFKLLMGLGPFSGARGILLLSGLTSRAEVEQLPEAPLYVAADLSAAVDWILEYA